MTDTLYDEPTPEEIAEVERRKAEVRADAMPRLLRGRGRSKPRAYDGPYRGLAMRETGSEPACPAEGARRAIRDYRRITHPAEEATMIAHADGLTSMRIGPEDILPRMADGDAAGPDSVPSAVTGRTCVDCGNLVGGRGRSHRADCPRAGGGKGRAGPARSDATTTAMPTATVGPTPPIVAPHEPGRQAEPREHRERGELARAVIALRAVVAALAELDDESARWVADAAYRLSRGGA